MAIDHQAGTEVEITGPGRQASEAEQHWEAKTLKPALEKSPERKERFTTL